MPDLAIIIPVLNERKNIPFVIDRLRSALYGISWEIIFVDDDSADGTDDAQILEQVQMLRRRVAGLN